MRSSFERSYALSWKHLLDGVRYCFDSSKVPACFASTIATEFNLTHSLIFQRGMAGHKFIGKSLTQSDIKTISLAGADLGSFILPVSCLSVILTFVERAKWSLGKVLYLACRYPPLLLETTTLIRGSASIHIFV